jgi:hypothetical protein
MAVAHRGWERRAVNDDEPSAPEKPVCLVRHRFDRCSLNRRVLRAVTFAACAMGIWGRLSDASSPAFLLLPGMEAA